MKVLSKKRKWKKNWKAESQTQKFYLYHFFYLFSPAFHNCMAWKTQKLHFESYSLLQKFMGKSEKWKVLSEKRKVKAENIIEKPKAKSKIFNFENCKRKTKVEVLWFRFPTLGGITALTRLQKNFRIFLRKFLKILINWLWKCWYDKILMEICGNSRKKRKFSGNFG